MKDRISVEKRNAKTFIRSPAISDTIPIGISRKRSLIRVYKEICPIKYPMITKQDSSANQEYGQNISFAYNRCFRLER
jgi:hypothetical protein